MLPIDIGTWTKVISFKHDGSFHRCWDKTCFIEENDEFVVVANSHTSVNESDGRYWQAKDPAISIYYKKRWLNIICMIRNNGVYYYCNIASPFVFDDDSIKYIDYDLDVSLAPNKQVKILDENEYKINKIIMRYKDKLDVILRHTLNEVANDMKIGAFPFNDELIFDYYDKFCKINNYVNHHEFIKK